MPFSGSCTNTKALQFSAAPTQADGITPAQVDPASPLRIEATDGSPLASAPDPSDPTNPLKCVAFVPDGFTAVVNCKAVLDADLGPGMKEIADAGTISFHDAEAANVGTTVGGEVDKP